MDIVGLLKECHISICLRTDYQVHQKYVVETFTAVVELDLDFTSPSPHFGRFLMTSYARS